MYVSLHRDGLFHVYMRNILDIGIDPRGSKYTFLQGGMKLYM